MDRLTIIQIISFMGLMSSIIMKSGLEAVACFLIFMACELVRYSFDRYERSKK